MTENNTTPHEQTRRRLRDVGLQLPEIPAPAGAYVPALVTGFHVCTSGQLPLVEGALAATGKVGEQIDANEATLLARACALNALAAAGSVIDLDRVVRVGKVVGFVASAIGFTGQPTVINGASELMASAFGAAGQHARSAVGVAELPLDAPVEVELVLEYA
ncbi:MAG: RidA family protein [Corynebacterium sp.]|uniref:RidA family protein n=1 Tax=unclassified Corynebacterium TaxID=2624378 RepID=UPI0009624791|nr:RidA family protein [Corynebacterium sp. CNJ-954]OLT53448.1 LysR family transcriptional regulator [Corynebacterium sp. CNJ-954]